eukprot:CAMPEP_0206198814 /NCGR_PEP_ID=MMETSP0166-20121206/9864_1 /ASSEMBLY_ACC=CAM_ASM_000260 /TAXON_ID=95228 /ORGANISM="Vannella robusta, Strain DIVA3 518/3/11/1/6" /LENGTH=469 /DNA_ID=CAMNT_0053616745 /DNA_START=119 /DNA_END=1528 /DNA_ORIENTATION=-
MTEVQAALDVLCLMLPRDARKACRTLVADVVHELESLDKKLVEDYSPQQFCGILGFCETYCCATPYGPQEIHISLEADDPTKMNIMWVTQSLCDTPTVRYGTSESSLTLSATGTSRTYHQGGWNGHIYLVQLENLKPESFYYYQVGDPEWKWSQVIYSFQTAPLTPVPANQEFTFITYGDMGSSNAADPDLYWLNEAARTHSADLILHIGDISYADGYQPGWDLFMQKIEPVAARIPYMTTAGNHEEFFDFTAYRYRFQMPVPEQNLVNVGRENMTLYYSFNYGNAHIVAISAEAFWGLAPNLHPGGAQHEWLINDLSSVDRETYPWVIAYLHRPLYCTNSNKCVTQTAYYRSLLEDIFNDYGVDLVLTAHQHDYERTLPVYQSMVVDGYNQSSTRFQNVSAPIYSVIGTGGNHEGLQDNFVSPPSWSVPQSRMAVWGYTTIQMNSTALTWNFLNAATHEVVDSFDLLK